MQLEGFEIVDDCRPIAYIHFLLDAHEIVTANAIATESLYTGPEALKMVGPAALAEIVALFPELGDAAAGGRPASARPFTTGKEARQLLQRHDKHQRGLLC
ncbi:Hint domain-containing protein [Paracoccus cavernae]|uniref:Hint domain-containing protein n=1 Tax=Paracoccus cavernae TaxID=1571207 RepID=UPI00362D2DC4